MALETILAERRESGEVNSRIVLIVGLGTLLLTGGTVLLAWLFLQSMAGPGPRLVPPDRFAPPRLQSDPQGELRIYLALQQARLEGYSWADRDQQLVQIPVTRAMRMIADRGAEAYAPLVPPVEPGPRR